MTDIEVKICIKCKIQKPIECFEFRKDTQKYRNVCIECINERARELYFQNKDKRRKVAREKYNSEKEHKRYIARRQQILEQKKQYYQNNTEILKEKSKEYKNKNQEYYKQYNYTYKKNRLKNDELFKFKEYLRSSLRKRLKQKDIYKTNSTEEIIGVKIEELHSYLLDTFKNNYGYEWDGIEKVHIDHIIPLASAKNEEEVIELCNYTNLQLLKAKDNLQKRDKLNWKLGGTI